MTIDRALARALEKNPELSAARSEIQAREGRVIQARSFPNPELEFEIENIYGNKDLKNLDKAESTLSLGQPFELAGKRGKRTEFATIDRDLAQRDYEAKKLDVISEVTKTFADAAAEQERVRLHEEVVRLAEQFLETASARVQAGKVSPIDETKASAALASARIDLERSRRSLEAARRRLASLWGSPSPDFQHLMGTITPDAAVPSFEELSSGLQLNPDVARWEQEIQQRNALLKIEKANRIPDPVVKAGVKRFNENNETAFLVGISLPLPIFNANTGAILEAEQRLSKAEVEQRASLVKARSALSDAYQALSASFAETTSMRETVIPAHQAAYEAILEGYRYGKFGYLDVLDTQRSLVESQLKYIDAATAYQKSAADIDRVTGGAAKGGSAGKER